MFNSCPPLERWSFLAKADKATWPDLPMDLRGIAVRSVVPHGSRLTALIKQQVLWVLSLCTSQFFPCKSWGCNLELLREVVLTAPDIYLPFATSCGNSTYPTPLPAAGLRPARGGRAFLPHLPQTVPLVPRSTKKLGGISAFGRASEPHLNHALILMTAEFKRQIYKIKTKLWALLF